MLGLAGLLLLRARRPAWTVGYVLALIIAGEGFPAWGAGPVLAGELALLAVLALAPRAVLDPPQTAGHLPQPRPTPQRPSAGNGRRPVGGDC